MKKNRRQCSFFEMRNFKLLKNSSGPAISTTSNASNSFWSDEEFFSPPTFEMNHKHEMILNNIRRGDEWDQNLQHVYGFTEAESCECFSRAGKYLYCSEFPEDAVNQNIFPHPKEGWVLLRELPNVLTKLIRENSWKYTGVLFRKERDRGSFERECCWSIVYSGWH